MSTQSAFTQDTNFPATTKGPNEVIPDGPTPPNQVCPTPATLSAVVTRVPLGEAAGRVTVRFICAAIASKNPVGIILSTLGCAVVSMSNCYKK